MAVRTEGLWGRAVGVVRRLHWLPCPSSGGPRDIGTIPWIPQAPPAGTHEICRSQCDSWRARRIQAGSVGPSAGPAPLATDGCRRDYARPRPYRAPDLSQSEDQNRIHPSLIFVHLMSKQVRGSGLGAAEGAPRSDPQIWTRARAGTTSNREVTQSST